MQYRVMKSTVLLFLFLFFLASCSQPEKRLALVGIIEIKSFNSSGKLIFSSAANTLTIYEGHGRFYDHDLANGCLRDSFVIAGLNGKNFDFYRRDSMVYVLETESNKIQCYSTTGNLLKEYDAQLSDKMLYAIRTPLYVGKNQRVFLYQTNLRLDPFSTNKVEAAQFYNDGLLAYYELSDSTMYPIDEHFGKYPAVYRARMFYNLFPASTPLSDSSFAYIFDAVPELFMYKNGKVTTHRIAGLNSNVIPLITSSDSLSSISFINSITNRSDGYLKLLYDANKRIYYLFQMHVLPRRSGDELSLFNDKPLTIYMIDSSYKVIGRKQFSDMKIYSYPLVAFVENGYLYLQRKTKKSIELERYEL